VHFTVYVILLCFNISVYVKIKAKARRTTSYILIDCG